MYRGFHRHTFKVIGIISLFIGAPPPTHSWFPTKFVSRRGDRRKCTSGNKKENGAIKNKDADRNSSLKHEKDVGFTDMADLFRQKTSRDSSADSKSSTGSGSSSTSEAERLRKLFNSCDADGDGYIDRNDFACMCKQLSLEEYTSDILQQLGVESCTKISFDDFLKFRAQVLIDAEEPGPILEDTDTGIEVTMNRTHAQLTSWPTMSSDSLGAVSGRPDSLDYDSGARDLQSPEPNITLQKMLEAHEPKLYKQITDSGPHSKEFLDLASRLHQAALTSLKGEIIELRSRLQRESLERDSLEKQLGKIHVDQRQVQEDYEERLDEITFRYEERITELHSVIAELRKKIERHQINVIREEDEDDLDPAVSTKSQDGGSLNDNTIGSQTQVLDPSGDLNSELSRVVTELEDAIHERKQKNQNSDDALPEDNEDDDVEEIALEVCKKMEDFSFEPRAESPTPLGLRPATFHPPPPPPPNEFPDPGYLQEEISTLRIENSTLQEQIMKQEVDLQRLRLALANLTEEKNKYKKQVTDHQTRLADSSSSPVTSRTSTPTKNNLQSSNIDRNAVNLTPTKASDQFPVAKVAELKKLKTVNSERNTQANELSTMPNTKVAEHLVQSLWKGSNLQEIVQNAVEKTGISHSDSRVTEFEIELERLQSQIDNYKSQLDVVNLTLDESKTQCDRLSVLIGKYESNSTALQLVLNYNQLSLETYEILCALLESELGVVLANCRAAGIGGIGDESFTDDEEEVASILHRAHQSRRASENVCKHLLHKLDKSFGVTVGRYSPTRPWEELSTTSKTTSTTSSAGSGDFEFTKADERRLRDYIQKLKGEQNNVQLTVMELESVHINPLGERPCKTPDAQRLDLENAVIMQELMAMKEEKAELKAQNYLLEKEKRALELKVNSMESQEHAYMVQIEHLKSEVTDQGHGGSQDGSLGSRDGSDRGTPPLNHPDFRGHDIGEIMHELSETRKREKKLKSQVAELVTALEKLSRNSEIRHQQSAEFVNDLKRANSALISAFDKAKKKYQGKLKKLESQMQSLTERYESQIRMLKQKLARKEEENTRLPNETSL